MTEQSMKRFSIIDGGIETKPHPASPKPDRLVPVFGVRKIKRQTMEGLEEVEQKYIIGFIEQERKV